MNLPRLHSLRPMLAIIVGVVALTEPAMSGNLFAGASYSDRYGATANVGLEALDIFDSGTDVELSYRSGAEGRELDAHLVHSHQVSWPDFGTNSYAGIVLDGGWSKWDINSYKTEHARFELVHGTDLSSALSLKNTVFVRYDKIFDLATDVSPLLIPDEGAQWLLGLTSDLTWSDRALTSKLIPGYDFQLGFGLGKPDQGRHSWAQVNMGYDRTIPAFGNTVINLDVQAGAIFSLSGGNYISIHDRAFLDGRAPRGFAWGSAGPIDASTDTALGGTKYISSSIEMLTPLMREGYSLGLFADAGTTWDLPGINSPTVYEEFDLRSSIGLSLGIETKYGRLKASFAEPIDYRDTDDIQRFSLSFQGRL